jgi:dethiobiotin synthetase
MQGRKLKAVFITASDTSAGKSIAAGLLNRYLLDKGYKAITQKWVQTGPERDIDTHFKFINKKINFTPPYALMMPYSFKFAASPHLAAKLKGRHIAKNKIIKGLRNLCQRFDFVLIEGTGGVLVPFNQKNFLIDIVKELDLMVLLIAANKVGSINHTLLSIEALRRRRIKILGIIFNNISEKENKIILKDNPRIVKKLTQENILGILPWSKNPLHLQKQFKPIGDKILKLL